MKWAEAVISQFGDIHDGALSMGQLHLYLA
jgi:hypothetical protein